MAVPPHSPLATTGSAWREWCSSPPPPSSGCFCCPSRCTGDTENPYLGILAFLTIPGPFFGGLVLIPLGMWLKRKREGRSGVYPPSFPPLNWSNPELRKLVYFVGVTTVVNIVIAQPVAYGAVNYMDSVTFCGQDLPYRDAARVHGLPELAALARGVRQMPHRPGRRLVREEQALRHRARCSRSPSTPIRGRSPPRCTTCARRATPAKAATGRRSTARTGCA